MLSTGHDPEAGFVGPDLAFGTVLTNSGGGPSGSNFIHSTPQGL